jgi:hypothetical protein
MRGYANDDQIMSRDKIKEKFLSWRVRRNDDSNASARTRDGLDVREGLGDVSRI